MIRVSVNLTKEHFETLKILAKINKTSFSQQVRISVDDFLIQNSENPLQEKKRLRALAGLRKVRNKKFRDIDNKKDLAINHDKYFNKIYISKSEK